MAVLAIQLLLTRGPGLTGGELVPVLVAEVAAATRRVVTVVSGAVMVSRTMVTPMVTPMAVVLLGSLHESCETVLSLNKQDILFFAEKVYDFMMIEKFELTTPSLQHTYPLPGPPQVGGLKPLGPNCLCKK